VRPIEIHYRRGPDRLQVFIQDLVVDEPELKVTLTNYTEETPLAVAGRTILEPGAPVVWFVTPGGWYDFGLFHLRDGTPTGCYTNFIRPPRMGRERWEMEDLCLDHWLGIDGSTEILDREEFEAAIDEGWIDVETAERVLEELELVITEAASGRWPPEWARELDLPKVRELQQKSRPQP
jgi:predicted RNA-binding protein associated with RNAse of E/G family